MIARIWHGYTKMENAPEYEDILRNEILPGIGRLQGYKGVQLLTSPVGEEMEFITILYFDDLASVKGFAGEDYKRAVIDPHADSLLTRYDEHSAHYEVAAMLLSDELINFPAGDF